MQKYIFGKEMTAEIRNKAKNLNKEETGKSGRRWETLRHRPAQIPAVSVFLDKGPLI